LIYRLFFRMVLRRLDPETTHVLAARALRAVAAIPGGLWALRALAGSPDPCLRVEALGLSFPSPLGVAAGLDKDASCFGALGALGFGFVEVGTVTAMAQAGNERPRIFRIARERALLNRMGFPNPGAQAAGERLRQRRAGATIVGVNVGKSRVTPLDDAPEDYRASARAVERLCDYLAVNVSSPNTSGLRELQTPERLAPIVAAIRGELSAAGARAPILIKISPDLTNAQLDELAELALELALDGIIAVNTTLDRSGLEDCPDIADIQGGGVSGAPLKHRALEVLRRLHARVGTNLVLVSVGGIETAEDAWERIQAGATLVQGYTGFVYNGPGWAHRINHDLAQRVHAAGDTSIQAFVGAAAARSTAQPL
jgi:dihydroorotate dehydrogenase